MVDEKIIESFRAMWGNFPGMVRLIQKDRTIIAVNAAAEAAGLMPGTRCIDYGPKDAHAVCLANQALKDKNGIAKMSDDGNMIMYWIPVEGCEDLYIHYVVLLSALSPAVTQE